MNNDVKGAVVSDDVIVIWRKKLLEIIYQSISAPVLKLESELKLKVLNEGNWK